MFTITDAQRIQGMNNRSRCLTLVLTTNEPSPSKISEWNGGRASSRGGSDGASGGGTEGWWWLR